MFVRYCNADCQRNHWPSHKKECKIQAAKLHDVALFKDPPAKEDCPICFLPMPYKLISCITLPPATIMSVPVYDFAIANEELADKAPEVYFSCCGKYICGGCMHSFRESGNDEKCPFCNSDRGKTEGEDNEDLMKRVEANDAFAMFVVGNNYMEGQLGLHHDREIAFSAMELWTQAAELGSSHAHYQLGFIYEEEGDLKKAKFHNEAAALFGHNTGRYNLGCMEFRAGNVERAVKHWTIAASGGDHDAMQNLLIQFKYGALIRHTIDSTLTAYNSSCKEMRSEARDTSIRNEE